MDIFNYIENAKGRYHMVKSKFLFILFIGLLSLGLLTACQEDIKMDDTEAAFSFSPLMEETSLDGSDNLEGQEADNTSAEVVVEDSLQQETQQNDTSQEDSKDQDIQHEVESSSSSQTTSDEKELTQAQKAVHIDYNNEPDVPMSVPMENPIVGVAGTKAERFFKTLSIEPVTYHYLLIPGTGNKELSDLRGEIEVYLSLSRGKSYMRVTTDLRDFSFLQLQESNYYEIDHNAKTYKILPGTSTQGNELSMDSFRQLEPNASLFIDTGKGRAMFAGREVHFEEFTTDAKRYVRYYFIGDVLVGHRTFENGQITQTVIIYEASNRYDEDLFQLPQGLKQVSE